MRSFYSFIACLTAMVVLSAPVHARQVVKIATIAPEGSHWHNAIREVEVAWEEISGGEIDVRIFAGGVAGSEADVVRKMRIGQIHGATLANFGLADIAVETLALSVPFIFRSDAEYNYVRDRVRGDYEALMEAKGYKVLAWSDIGWAYLFSRSPVTQPDELAKLRLGTVGSQTTVVDAWRAAGYRTVLVSLPELLPSLQSGLAEAVFSVPAGALAFQWYRAAPHMTDIKISPVPGALVISTRAWDRLPENLKPQLIAAAKAAGQRSEDVLPSLEKEALEAMAARGLKIHPVAPSESQIWEKRAVDGRRAVIGSTIPKDAFDRVLELVAEYRANTGGQ